MFLFLLLAGFDAFYFINRRLFLLLEREDWPALAGYLEERVIRNGRYSSSLVRLLANTYLVLSDSAAVMNLENKVAIAKPSLVDANVLIFGTARILGRDIPGAVRFFEARTNSTKPAILQWVRWYHGFALLLNRQAGPAADVFITLAKASDNALITGLAAFFLEDILKRDRAAAFGRLPAERKDELAAASQEGRERVLKFLKQEKDWKAETAKIASEIHAAAIAQYLEEAGRFIYI